MVEPEIPSAIHDAARVAWNAYVDFLTPFRPELYKYCRRLTGDVWDAEDLVQDTIIRGFGVLSQVHRAIDNPRGYLIRIATNLWVDGARRRKSETNAATIEEARTLALTDENALTTEARDAAAHLMQMLAPQERAALVLKEVFEVSLDETAAILGTSVGAVKAALHRGRRALRQPEGSKPLRPRPSAALVDRFVERLNASDLPGLLALMLDTASVEMAGNLLEVGRGEFEAKGSWLWQAVNVHPDLPAHLRPPKFLNERATFDGEPIMVAFMVHGNMKLLMAIVRFEEDDDRIARLRAYNFNPELIHEVGERLGLPCGVVPYRFPTLPT